MDIPSKKQVQKAGKALAKADSTSQEYRDAMAVLSYWRGLHGYPISAFNTLLRQKAKQLNLKSPLIAQRLKRTPSIIKKLQRFPSMSLATMQDIGGLRVVLGSIDDVYRLHKAVMTGSHEPILPPYDYIAHPKADGYRSLHQVFKYQSNKPDYQGLQIELQLRTKLQHAWATAVETLGMLEKSSFKTGEWTQDYSRFFKLASALFSHHEKQPILDELAGEQAQTLAKELLAIENKLQIFAKLQGLILTAKSTKTKGAGYHLMELDLSNNTVNLVAFDASQFELAQSYYKMREMDTKDDVNIELVLISVGNIRDIKKAYPNYFLDTQEFIKHLTAICRAYGG